MSNDPEREAFEQYAATSIAYDFDLQRHQNGLSYENDATEAAWCAWAYRAARSLPPVQDKGEGPLGTTDGVCNWCGR